MTPETPEHSGSHYQDHKRARLSISEKELNLKDEETAEEKSARIIDGNTDDETSSTKLETLVRNYESATALTSTARADQVNISLNFFAFVSHS